MLGFAFIVFIQSWAGIYAAWEAVNLSAENPWDKVEIDKISGKMEKDLRDFLLNTYKTKKI